MTNILIYTMGRVGSTSIKRSLSEVHTLIDCHYAGSIPPRNECEKSTFYGLGYHRRDFWNQKKLAIFRRRRACSQLIKKANLNDTPLKIVTLIRPPLEQAFSRYLYNFRYSKHPNFQEIEHVFYGLRWLDCEFAPNTDIDVYSHKFNLSQGYSIIRQKNLHALILRTDLSNRLKEQALTDLGLSPSPIVRGNTTTSLFEKPLISQARDAFVSSVIEDPHNINQILSSRMVRHFFSEEEAHDFPCKALTYINNLIK